MEKEEGKPEQEHNMDFFVPERCCSERLHTPQFPSPEDCLPLGRLAELNERILEANELLLNLALDDNRSIQETYQKAFDGLMGLQVEITSQLGELIEGKVTLSGLDFVVLREKENLFIVPHGQIELIIPSGRFAEPFPEPGLLDIDSYSRRKLTFHFGETVSSSPELIQLFFRIPLSIYLLIFEGKRVQVKVGDALIEGCFTDVNKESIDLQTDEELTIIPFSEVLLIVVKA